MQNLKGGGDGTSFVITGSKSAKFYFSGSTSGKLGIGTTRVLRIPTKEDFEKIGKRVMLYMELEMPDKADHIMQDALDNRHITGIQYRQLKEIIKHMNNEK